MGLTTRQEKILRATIADYIELGEPVGSKALSGKASLAISPATIRHELGELEVLGYIQQVHTSSGRVPTDNGYRLYIDQLMRLNQLPSAQKQVWTRQIQAVGSGIQTVLVDLSHAMASMTQYAAVVIAPDLYREALKVVHLLLLDLDRVLVVLLNSVGVNREFVISLNDRVGQEDLNRIATMLSEKLNGKTLSEIDTETFAQLLTHLPKFSPIVQTLMSEIQRLLNDEAGREVWVQGQTNLLRFPEFRDVEAARRVMESLEEKKVMLGLLAEYLRGDQKRVVIGTETKVDGLTECSVVISPFTTPSGAIGAIGMVGPKRMHYEAIIPLMTFISDQVSKRIQTASDRQLSEI